MCLSGRLIWFWFSWSCVLFCLVLSRRKGHCTYVLRIRLKALLHAVVAQADDVPGVQATVPAHAHAVPQHHTHAARVVAHLDHSLDACDNNTGFGLVMLTHTGPAASAWSQARSPCRDSRSFALLSQSISAGTCWGLAQSAGGRQFPWRSCVPTGRTRAGRTRWQQGTSLWWKTLGQRLH